MTERIKKFKTLCEEYAQKQNNNAFAGKKMAVRILGEAIRAKKLSPENVSIKDVYEGLMGFEVPRHGSSVEVLQESAINTQLFMMAIGHITQFTLMGGYDEIPKIARSMVSIVPGVKKRIGNKARLKLNGDRIPKVKEGETYTNVAAADEYISYLCEKYGASVAITMETIREDDTGKILDTGMQLGRAMAKTEEMLILEGMVQMNGSTSVYKPLGVATDIFTATASTYRVNIVTANPLDNFKNIQAARKIAKAIRIEAVAKAEFAGVKLVDLLIPSDIEEDARKVLFAKTVQTFMAGDPATVTENENANLFVAKPRLFVSEYLTEITPFGSVDATKTWYVGDFKRAFSWMQISAPRIETLSGSELAFTNDIPLQYKVYSEGGLCCDDPRFILQCRPT